MEIELYDNPGCARWVNSTDTGLYHVGHFKFLDKALEDGTQVHKGFDVYTVLMVDKVKQSIIYHKARFDLQELLNLVLAETGDKLILLEDGKVHAQGQGKDDQNMTVKGGN